jgi:hypothetical protein
VVRNGELTREACGAVEEDGIDSENWEISRETPNRRVPQLHRKVEDMKDALDHVADDKRRREDLSPADGGGICVIHRGGRRKEALL